MLEGLVDGMGRWEVRGIRFSKIRGFSVLILGFFFFHEVYGSLVFRIVTKLYNHHHYVIPEHLHHPRKQTLHLLINPAS